MKYEINLRKSGFLVKPDDQSSLDILGRDLRRHIDADIKQHNVYTIIVDDVEYDSREDYLESLIGNFSLFPVFDLVVSSKPNDLTPDHYTDRTLYHITSDAQLREVLYNQPYIHKIQTANQYAILTVIAMADEIINVKKLEIEVLREIKTETKTIYRVGA